MEMLIFKTKQFSTQFYDKLGVFEIKSFQAIHLFHKSNFALERLHLKFVDTIKE